MRDPREVLLILWDDLSPSERATALRELGYPPGAGPRELLKGPHPAWFAGPDLHW